MPAVQVMILQPPLADDAGPLSRVLDEARAQLTERHARLFLAVGAHGVERLVDRRARSFGERVAERAAELRAEEGLVVLGAGSLARLTLPDARRLVRVAAAGRPRDGERPVAATNNRYSSDACAVPLARVLADLPPLPNDNVLPRWLEAFGGYRVAELPGRLRLAFDLDTPLDLALLALLPSAPSGLRAMAARAGLAVPRLAELRAVAASPRAELLVFGRASSRGLAFLERRLPCRVRFLSEERGLRTAESRQRPPRATLGRLLEVQGPAALGAIVRELADAAILDLRVILADRLGSPETAWPPPDDRFAADLLRPADVADPWLRSLVAAAATGPEPILLGGHTLVGPGLPVLLAGAAGGGRMPLRVPAADPRARADALAPRPSRPPSRRTSPEKRQV